MKETVRARHRRFVMTLILAMLAFLAAGLQPTLSWADTLQREAAIEAAGTPPG